MSDTKKIVGVPFQKGKPGGPGAGRRKMDETTLATLDICCVQGARVAHEAQNATKENSKGVEVPDHAIRLRATEMVWDRMYGKSVQAIAGEDGGPVRVEIGEVLDVLRNLVREP